MEQIFLGLGTNVAPKEVYLSAVKIAIEKEVGPIVQASSLYETAAWGKTDQSDFMNQVIEIRSQLSPIEVLDTVLAIEKKMGRVRVEKWAERIIDIDLLFYGQEMIQTPRLIVPHPFISVRNFVLAPLVEIAPNFIHPIVQQSIAELYRECPDQLAVRKIESPS